MPEKEPTKAGWGWPARALAVLVVGVVLSRACGDDVATPQATPATPDPAQVAQRAQAAAAREAQDCTAKIDAKKQEYARLRSERKHWDAALELRSCADALQSAELRKLVREAEIASHMADINDPKKPPRDKARAMFMLARDYPDVGAKYAAQADKLIEAADRQEAAAEKRRKRSEGVRIGMTMEDVLASSWGRPQSVNKTTTSRGTREQWVYGGGYLYFENGVLTAIQN